MLKDAADYADGLSTDPKLIVSLAIKPYGVLIHAQRELDHANGRFKRVVKQLLWVDVDTANANFIVVAIDRMLEELRKA